jgi:EpsI family protein
MNGSPFAFLKRREVQLLTVFLLLQALGLAFIARTENPAVIDALNRFPAAVGGWVMVQDNPIEEQVLNVLKADDTLNRVYASKDGGATASIFIAYFRSQQNGKAPHSPKNCLPGAGWTPVINDKIAIMLPGRDEPAKVNHFVVQQGDHQSVVLYWYQGHGHIIASEYLAKIYLVLDSIKLNKSDTALVRIVVPATTGTTAKATGTAIALVQALYPELKQRLP